jgi:hypothetical protein
VSVGDLCRACGKEGRKEIILFSTSSRWASKNNSLLGDQLRPELLLLLLLKLFFGFKKKGLVDIWHAHISSFTCKKI